MKGKREWQPIYGQQKLRWELSTENNGMDGKAGI
jgi:hypothetical protein